MSIRTFFRMNYRGLPPHGDVDFTIELHCSTFLILMTPHRMAPTEL